MDETYPCQGKSRVFYKTPKEPLPSNPYVTFAATNELTTGLQNQLFSV